MARCKRSVMISKLTSEIADIYRLLREMPTCKSIKQEKDAERMQNVINNHGLEIDRLRAELGAKG